MLKVLELSELFEPNRIEINRIETKSIESNRNQSNRIEFRVRIKFESFTVPTYAIYQENNGQGRDFFFTFFETTNSKKFF